MQAKVKAKGSAQPLVVSASRLRDGRVVWLAADGRWVEPLRDAAVYLGEQVNAGLAAGEADERRQLVVGAYAVEVVETPDGLCRCACASGCASMGRACWSRPRSDS